MTRPFRHKHLLGIEGLEPQDVIQILDTAEVFFEVSRRPVRKVPTLPTDAPARWLSLGLTRS